MSKLRMFGPRMLLACVCLGVALPLCAQTIPVQCTALASHGISVSQAVADVHDQATIVEVHMLRPRTSRAVPTQTLEFAIIGADGSVRAEQRRTVGPAQLPRDYRGRVRIAATLTALPVAGDRIVVEWVAQDH